MTLQGNELDRPTWMKTTVAHGGIVGDGPVPHGSQAIVRAIGVLRAFSHERTAITITEIAAMIGVSVPTAHRIATTLEAQGLLARDHNSKAFSLGPEILRLARLMTERRPSSVNSDVLASLREVTGETVSLQVRVGDRRVCVAEEVSRQPIRITSGVGQSYPLTAGAAGKAILSLLADDEVARLIDLPVDPDARPLARRELLTSVRQARERGYAISEGETVRGAIALSVPLPSADGAAPSAINLVGPRDRMTKVAIAMALAAIRAAVQPLRDQQVGA
jgi:DNA-binding IclR family transcriptional regulator